MKPLGRFYTADAISGLLVSRFRHECPQNILDLGVGNGSLLNAAYNRWQNATYHAADIDPDSITRISNKLPFVQLRNIDSLSSDFNKQMCMRVDSVDVAVCNPPYLRIKNSVQTMTLLKEARMRNSLRLKRITSDIVFLAQNLIMLKEGGELGIILPDSIFNGHEFVYLREDILTNCKITGVIQLPDKIFAKTEARTHILLLEKGGTSDSFIALYKSNDKGEVASPIYISKEEAIQRMDFSFYSWKNRQSSFGPHVILDDLEVELKRGRSSKKELQAFGIKFFHTSSFPKKNSIVELENSFSPGEIQTQPGDILISRVGKRCIGRVSLVKSGNQVISDCVYRLRVPEKYREITWKVLMSREGKEWLEAHAHGVCSRCISKKDILTFPIPL